MEMKGGGEEERIWELERDSRSLNELGVTEGWVGGKSGEGVWVVSRELLSYTR